MDKKQEIDYVRKLLYEVGNKVLKDRLENLLIWNINKATFYKKVYYIMSISIIVINASIPIIIQIPRWNGNELVASVFSVLASIFTSILALISMKDKWYRYRKYSEMLKRECFLFIARCEPYNKEDRDYIFAENIEEISTEERELWEKLILKSKHEEIK